MIRWIAFFCAFIFTIQQNSLFAGRNKDSLRVTREIYGSRLDGPIRIDGFLSEPNWKHADIANGFLIYEPFNGAKASQPSEVMVLYDDYAIYVGARLFDSKPDSIYRDLGQRDNSDKLRADAFSVYLSTYNDGINYLQFTVSASGVQTDIRIASGKSDRNWNAVWESAVAFDSMGWQVEMKIPYSALRFSNNTNQVWGVNFSRLIKRMNEISTWNFVDKSQSGFVTQSGILKGISGIKPPVRLSFLPYLSAYADHYPDSKGFNKRYAGGMDLKLGLAQNFTLDATLIPDFGQVKSDDKILNLSPFEVKYNEARQFFTEGMELYGKASIFYSRRIGGQPVNYYVIYDSLKSNEVVVENPQEAKMINATKISGRFANGLGLGFFNSMTQNTYAEILDTITGLRHRLLTQGFTNYNVTVFDQNLPNNSYISLINTNVFRPTDNFTANVTATELFIKNQSQSYGVYGVGSVSQRVVDSTQRGFKSYLSFSKISGSLKGDIWLNIESKQYNPNDLGYLKSPNEFSSGVKLSYNVYDPFWKFLNMETGIEFSNNRLYSPWSFQSQNISFKLRFTTVTNFSGGLNVSLNPTASFDYYEPRVEGRKLKLPRVFGFQWWGSTDYRKTVAVDHRLNYWFSDDYNQRAYSYTISPRVRVSDRLLMIYSWVYQSERNNLGYYTTINDEIIIGSRKLVTITNSLNFQYAFTAKSFLNFRARHYIRHYKYNAFYALNINGSLSPTDLVTSSQNLNYNLFNIDMFYQWFFAPGSEMVLAWKNMAEEMLENPVYGYMQNIEGIWNAPQYNSLSIKILYYFDYQMLKKLKG